MKAKPFLKATGSKQRLLEAACQLFAERGFHGTYLREVCRRAGISVSIVQYYFHGKEKLYEAVALEACRRLALPAKHDALLTANMAPKQRLQVIIESLFERLSGDSEWIANLAIRESVEPIGTIQNLVGTGLRKDLLLLQPAIRAMLGPQTDRNMVRLRALSVLSLCVFYCVAKATVLRIFPEFDKSTLSPENLAKHVMHISLGASDHSGRGEQEEIAVPLQEEIQ